MRGAALRCVLGSLVVAAVLGAGPARGQQPPAASVGRWYFWVDVRDCELLAAEGDSLWFGATGVFWRYDVPSGTIERFSMLEGLPVMGRPVTDVRVSARGDCAVAYLRTVGAGSVCVRPAGGEWVCLPAPARQAPYQDVAFGEEGRVAVLLGDPMHGGPASLERWDGTDWTPLAKPASARGLWRLPGRWVVASGRQLVSFRDDGAEAEPLQVPVPPMQLVRLVHWDGQDYAIVDPRNPGQVYNLQSPPALSGCQVHALGPEGVEPRPLFEGFVGLDLRTHRPFELRPIEPADGGTVCEVHGEAPYDGLRVTVPAQTATPGWKGRPPALPVIDGNGHLWVGPHRWDGRSWSLVLPDWQMPFADRRGPIDRIARLEVGDGQARWQLLPTAPPPDLAAWDPAERTGWRVTEPGPSRELQLVHVGEDGQEEILRRVPWEQYLGIPALRTPDGAWWWTYNGGGGEGLFRLTGRLDSTILPDAGLVMRGADSDMWVLDPAKAVGEPLSAAFRRYDERRRRLVSADPSTMLDAQAFTLGPWTLAAPLGPDGTGVLFVREEGAWRLFPSPFAQGPVGPVAPLVRVCGPMVHGDRLLVTAREGVLEYSASRGEWVRLDGGSGASAWFDDQGRCLIGFRGRSLNPSLLVFDGDPFAPVPDPRRERFERLLAQLASDSYAERQRASEDLASLGTGARDLVQEALGREDLDPEARVRLEDLHLPGPAAAAPPSAPDSLLRRMHPPVPALSLPPPKPQEPQVEVRDYIIGP